MLRYAVASIIAVSTSLAAKERIAPAVAIVHRDNQDIYYANNRKNKHLEETYLKSPADLWRADRRVPQN